MARKCGCILWAVCMMMTMGLKVQAAQREGTLQVIPAWCGRPVAEGTVSVSRVGRNEGDRIILTDGLADWSLDAAVLPAEDWIGWLSQHTGQKRTAAVTAEFGAVFENLEAGIYLVEQTEHTGDYLPFHSFLQSVPEDGQWKLTVCPKLTHAGEPPKTADRPAPIIGAMGIGLSAAILMVLSDRRKK